MGGTLRTGDSEVASGGVAGRRAYQLAGAFTVSPDDPRGIRTGGVIKRIRGNDPVGSDPVARGAKVAIGLRNNKFCVE